MYRWDRQIELYRLHWTLDIWTELVIASAKSLNKKGNNQKNLSKATKSKLV